MLETDSAPMEADPIRWRAAILGISLCLSIPAAHECNQTTALASGLCLRAGGFHCISSSPQQAWRIWGQRPHHSSTTKTLFIPPSRQGIKFSECQSHRSLGGGQGGRTPIGVRRSRMPVPAAWSTGRLDSKSLGRRGDLKANEIAHKHLKLISRILPRSWSC